MKIAAQQRSSGKTPSRIREPTPASRHSGTGAKCSKSNREFRNDSIALVTHHSAKAQCSHPDDEYEREADRIADRVMRMAEPAGDLTALRAPTVSRDVFPRISRKCSRPWSLADRFYEAGKFNELQQI